MILFIVRIMATGVKGIQNPDKTTQVRAEAEGSAAALLSLWALHESQTHLAPGAKLGVDATGIIYGVNKKTGKLDGVRVRT